MELSDFLAPEAVRAMGRFTSKKRLFRELGDIAHQAYEVDPALVVEGLQEREALGPTGVGHGIALPHARLDGLTRIVGLFLRLDKPQDYDSVDRQPVDLVFCLLAPNEPGVDHLKALALVSRTMRDETIVQKLRANTEPAKLHAILTESNAEKAEPDARSGQAR